MNFTQCHGSLLLHALNAGLRQVTKATGDTVRSCTRTLDTNRKAGRRVKLRKLNKCIPTLGHSLRSADSVGDICSASGQHAIQYTE